nr:MAG TPA: hypothetical protein [Caudoviricetes sp.]
MKCLYFLYIFYVFIIPQGFPYCLLNISPLIIVYLQ